MSVYVRNSTGNFDRLLYAIGGIVLQKMLVDTVSSRLSKILCFVWVGFISCDVVVDIMCVIPLSDFPLTKYDSIVRQISKSDFASPTAVRVDLITGAAARDKYFPGSGDILRFQLLHITRVHSMLQLNGQDPALIIGALRGKLMDAMSSNVGMCGIDDISDSTSGSSTNSSDRSWFMDMPALVAPVALIGWIVTSLICGGCWFYYVFYASPNEVPLAAVVQLESTVSHGMPSARLLDPHTAPVVNQPTIDMTAGTPSYNSSVSTRRQEQNTRPMSANLHAAMPTGPTSIHTSIEFYKPNHESIPCLINMRLPSFENHHSKLFAGQTSSLGRSAV